MAQYDIAFGETLARTAQMVIREGVASLDAQRTVLYLSLLSVEISLKAMLEQAGQPVSGIRTQSHRLDDLLSLLDQCEVEIEVTPGNKRYVSAARIRSCLIKRDGAERSGPACLNRFTPRDKETACGLKRCRVVHGGGGRCATNRPTRWATRGAPGFSF